MIKKLKLWHGVAIGILIGAIVTGLLGAVYIKQTAKKYGYVNVKAVMGLVLKNLTGRDFGKANYDQIVKEQRDHFVSLLDAYSEKNNYVILNSPKPVGGAVDLTHFFLNEMQISLDQAYLASRIPDDEEMLIEEKIELNKQLLP